MLRVTLTHALPLFCLAIGACGPKTTATDVPRNSGAARAPIESSATEGEGVANEPEPDAFTVLAESILDAHLQAHPTRAVELGLHGFDGRLPDMSAAGLAADLRRLQEAIASLQGVDEAGLSSMQRVERHALLTALRGDAFALEVERKPWRNPMSYVEVLDLTPYVSREYAPVQTRAKAVISVARSSAAHLSHAKENLEERLPRTFIDTALLQARGTLSFVRDDVPRALALKGDEKKALDAALAEMAAALEDYVAFLQKRRKKATSDFALGEESFTRMLAETQGIEVDLGRLESVLEADLERNLAALRETARAIDPKASIRKVVAKVAEDKPAPDDVLREATRQAEEMRAFLVEREIVTIPSPDLAEVVESPPFMRWNAAFLSAAGPFEEKALPSFYYISPPDPAWPEPKQRAYIPGRTDLLFITIHEVWPGHFLHGLHLKKVDSRVLRSLWNYTTGEGWAHYTEEMMWEAGISSDPAVHVGQLLNALLRNVRALSAIRLHTGKMTVAQSKAMFESKAFQDEANAEQQAVRGTFDPMYLAYTVGKLAILKLREDWIAARKAAGEPADSRTFHDTFLSHAAAPLPAIRRAMLSEGGETSGSIF